MLLQNNFSESKDNTLVVKFNKNIRLGIPKIPEQICKFVAR